MKKRIFVRALMHNTQEKRVQRCAKYIMSHCDIGIQVKHQVVNCCLWTCHITSWYWIPYPHLLVPLFPILFHYSPGEFATPWHFGQRHELFKGFVRGKHEGQNAIHVRHRLLGQCECCGCVFFWGCWFSKYMENNKLDLQVSSAISIHAIQYII